MFRHGMSLYIKLKVSKLYVELSQSGSYIPSRMFFHNACF